MALTKDAEKLNSLFLQLCNPKVVQRAAQKAIELDWQLGIPVMQADEKGIYELRLDGTKIYQKKQLFGLQLIVSAYDALKLRSNLMKLHLIFDKPLSLIGEFHGKKWSRLFDTL